MSNSTPIIVAERTINTGATKAAYQVQDTNGTINVTANGSTDRLILDVENADDAAVTLTIQAPSCVQSNIPEELALTLAATGTATDKRFWGPFESQKICKADGSFDILIAGGASPIVNIRAIRLPKM
jgi:hypothetical protein